jgi:uncharacterized protein YwgA
MDRRLHNLQLVLEKLGVGSDIDSIDRRVTIQKAVYLAQEAGIPLLYRYNWYVMGPYSPNLTRDYYALQEQPWEALASIKNMTLKEPFASVVTQLKAVMDPPEDVHLNTRDWLELLASAHYLRAKAELGHDETRLRLDAVKPHISNYTDQATETLKQLRLLQG